jgi:hypothetical protein
LILQNGTRSGFCCNTGCTKKEFRFIFKYYVYYIPKYGSFYYGVFAKGRDSSSFIIGESTFGYLSFDSKSVLNDGFFNNEPASQILRLNKNMRIGKINLLIFKKKVNLTNLIKKTIQ